MNERLLAVLCALICIGCQSSPAPAPPPREPPPVEASPESAVEAEPPSGDDQAVTDEDDTAAPQLDYIELTTGRADAFGELPMVVVIHGYGDSPEGIAGLLRSFPEPARVILPRGPNPHPRQGHSWYTLGAPSTGDEISTSAERIVALVADLTTDRPTVGRPIVTGFSQGGMLSFTLAAEHDGVFAAAFPIAGRLTDFDALGDRAARRTTIHAFHGAVDERIPLADAQLSMEAMVAAGWDVQMTVVPELGHSVNAALRQELHQALAEALPE